MFAYHYVPATDYNWDENFNGDLKTLTCINHTSKRWATKHLRDRSLLYYGDAETGLMSTECDCPLSDLMVQVPGAALVKVGAKPAK